IMATALSHLPAAEAGLATVFFLATACGNAWADNRAEQPRWQSAITEAGPGSSACANRQWKSALTAIDARNSVRLRASDGSIGVQETGGGECGAPEALDGSGAVAKSARGSVAPKAGSAKKIAR